MFVNNIVSQVAFTGEIHPTLRSYIDKQRGALVENEAKKVTPETGYNECVLKIGRINEQVDRVLKKFENKAKKMHKNTEIGIQNKSKYGDSIEGGYWLCATNKNMPKNLFSCVPSGAKVSDENESETECALAPWQVTSKSNPNDTSVEVLDRLETLADAIDPEKTDKKLLRHGRHTIEKRFNALLEKNKNKKISGRVKSRAIKYAKEFDKVENEIEDDDVIKKCSLLKMIKCGIKEHNKGIDIKA